MRVLGLIPARGGSKGVRRKNIRELCGKPLLHYTAAAARESRSLTRVVLSTEDEEVAAVGMEAGIDVPFLRPPHLAADETPMLPVVQHAIRFFEDRGETFDAVCLLQPTNPLRTARDIDEAVSLLVSTDADSVIALVDIGEKHPARMKMLDPEGRIIDPPFCELFEGQRRQELSKLYLREGSIYLTRTRVLMDQGSFQGRDSRGLLIPEERAINIDREFDLVLAELLIQHARQVDDNELP